MAEQSADEAALTRGHSVASLIERIGLVSELTSKQRGRVFSYRRYDFESEWLLLAARMVDPDKRSLMIVFRTAVRLTSRSPQA